mmetsp:Transcript_13789/g.19274  ORF Transcript_13789/g.19274 Transcript_13789/m.19274 type:complete len:93 (+) Transcript_13789:287-565(+)
MVLLYWRGKPKVTFFQGASERKRKKEKKKQREDAMMLCYLQGLQFCTVPTEVGRGTVLHCILLIVRGAPFSAYPKIGKRENNDKRRMGIGLD